MPERNRFDDGDDALIGQTRNASMKTAALFLFGMALAPGPARSSAPCEAQSGAGTGALLELYTSEGCSSCPPADRWFSQLAAGADPRGLSLLAFHVDYWDQIGWPDRFARHTFTVRQGRRVRTGGSSTVYTPQVMLSSQLGLRWNQPGQVLAAIEAIRRKPSPVALRLSAQPHSERWLVSLDAMPTSVLGGNPQLFLAMYENGLNTAVRAGENAGATLHHERVVRGLWGPWPMPAAGAPRRLQVTPPPDARPGQLGLTAFVQNPDTGETLQALSMPLQSCARVERATGNAPAKTGR